MKARAMLAFECYSTYLADPIHVEDWGAEEILKFLPNNFIQPLAARKH